MITEIRAHIERKFDESKIEPFPFPHMVVEGIFPEQVFSRMLALNPFVRDDAGHAWISREKSAEYKTGTPYYLRTQIDLYKDERFPGAPEIMRFWQDIKDCLLEDHWFARLVLKKYYDYFVIRFGELIEDADFYDFFRTELFLCCYEPGFFLGPHTDLPTRVFTGVFAFPDKEGFEEYGTQLLVPHDRLTRCWGNNHHGFEGFDVRAVAPYKPNNFALFFNTRQTFHSVKKIDDGVTNRRFSLQIHHYEPEGGLFNDLSAPHLYENKHKKADTR